MDSPLRDQKVNKNPRLSLNALSKYASANARSRRSILKEAKYPPDFKVIYYADATNAITRYLLNREYSLDDAAERISSQEATSPTELTKRTSNAQAVKRFAILGPTLSFDGLRTSRGPTQGNIIVSGVTISVRPEIVLSGVHRTFDCAGLVKLHFSKAAPTDETGGAIAGAVLKRYADMIREDRRVHNRHLVLVDVFAGAVHLAPNAIISRGHELDAMCNEIAVIWPTI